MRLLLATGGTGGHIYPAMALAEAAKKRYQDIEILFVGNADSGGGLCVSCPSYKRFDRRYFA